MGDRKQNYYLKEVSLARGEEGRQLSLCPRLNLNFKHKAVPRGLLGIVNVDDLV